MSARAFKSAIYGWSIVWKPQGQDKWVIDDHEESNGLPAIFEDWNMAVDRLAYLESKGVVGRMVAVLVHPSDFKVDGKNKFIDGAQQLGGWWPHMKRKKKRRDNGGEEINE